MRPNLNAKPLRDCYAFELRIIVENKREDGMRGSPQRRLSARRELAARASNGDTRAIDQLDALGCCPHGFPDQGDGCESCSNGFAGEHAVTHIREHGLYSPGCSCGWRGARTSIESLSLAQGAAHLRGVNR